MLGHGGSKESGQSQGKRKAAELGEFGKVGALFFAGVQKHDDEDEKHHDRAAIDDDLHRGHELCAHQQVEPGERDHHDDERECAMNGMLLQDQADCADYGERSEKKENDQWSAHLPALQRTAPAVRITLAMETGSKSFQPMFMSWS